jgi:superfamily II DNA or RNA helicase
MIENMERNELIVRDVVESLHEGRFPLVLTERREHLEILAKLLEGKVEVLFQLHGGVRQKARRESFEKIKESPEGPRKIILATGSYIGEGFDAPRLDTLFLTMPSSFKGKIVQYAGRLHRYHKDKTDIRIYDYVDKKVSVLERMFQRRLKTYKMLGYEVKN